MLFSTIISLLRKLVELGQERNTYALESLSEQRKNNELLRSVEQELDKQTDFLKEIAADLKPPAAGQATKLVLTLGSVVPQ